MVTLSGHAGWVNSAFFTANDDLIATSGVDGTVRLWTLVATIASASRAPVNRIAISPDGTQIIVASDDAKGAVFSLHGDASAVLRGHAGLVSRVRFDPQGKRLAMACSDGSVRVWDLDRRQTVAVLAGHTDVIWDVAFSPDGRRLATASSDGKARIWTLASPTAPLTIAVAEQPVVKTVFLDDKKLMTRTEDGSRTSWDAVTGASLSTDTSEAPPGETDRMTEDYRLMIDDGEVRVERIRDGRTVARLYVEHAQITYGTFSPAGDRIGTAVDDGTARIWNTETGTLVAVFRGHTRPVKHVAFSPDGDWLATASLDGTARLYRVFPDTEAAMAYAKDLVGRPLSAAERATYYLPTQ